MAQANLSLAERLESLKAGTITGAMAAVAEGTIQLLQVLPSIESGAGLDSGYWLDVAIAAFSGFLFGVTCRYAIRQDENPHLSSGVILAFGLVRGLAQMNGPDLTPSMLPLIVFAVLESIVLFAIAYLGLSASIRFGWVKSCS
jgi:hypothetical protein